MDLSSLGSEGPLFKARETVRIFLDRRPPIRDLLASRSPTFDRLHAVVPSTATTGEAVDLTVQAWDEYERLLDDFDGTVSVTATDPDASVPATVRFDAYNGGVRTETGLCFETPGTHYLTLTNEQTGESFHSNPIRVFADEPDFRLYWGDIHLHSILSDGVGSMAKGYRFGRDVMDLDVAAFTDHDTMGFFIPPSLQRKRMHDGLFDRMKRTTEEFHEDGEFVTLFGYEWTKQPNVGGHINVYFDDTQSAELFDSHDPETDTYEKLWARLREWNDAHETDVVSIPHHPAEAMYPFDFSEMAYDDEMAPLVEVYSQWGSSERPGSDGNQYPLEMGQGEMNEPGHYVQDALQMGYRVGMNASADYHGPHPGHSLIHAKPHLPSLSEWLEDGLGWGLIWRVWNERSYPGGLHAFYAPELTREAIFDSLQSRRVYGTTQPHRIVVDFRIDDQRVGEADSEVSIPEADAAREVTVEAAGTAPIERVELVKNNAVWHEYAGTDDPDADLDSYTADLSWTDDAPVEGMRWDEERGTDDDTYYVRLTQADGGMAWAGPIWVTVADADD
ncbi:DUF3604 domain-containing protein [Salinirubrum litoreum]|uniref:DUF3604 domain-containing protein n=1 Tax=Salinirubrum litoreum TaxID=1126234 RepID=A0ABD5RFC2_9EURY|nr:DUF3604 domain-containing protein [Salinirubrum litoreum]